MIEDLEDLTVIHRNRLPEFPWYKRCFMLINSLKEYETEEIASGLKYRTKWRGDNVINISPEGIYYPLYKDKEILEEVPIRRR